MTEIADGWEIVSRRANNPFYQLVVAFQFLFGIPEAPRAISSVTWTVRQAATGSTRQVTAYSQAEASEKIALGLFDDA